MENKDQRTLAAPAETLASALCKAQSEFLPAAQSGYNPHFKSSFSTMTDLIRATRPSLKKYGLSVIQDTECVMNDQFLITKLMFNEEREVSRTFICLKDPTDQQAFGKACSYISRYIYKMMLGIETSDEDDDGNSSANIAPRSNLASEAQVKFLSQLLVGKDDIKKVLLEAEGVDSLSKLSFDIVSKSITKLKGQ